MIIFNDWWDNTPSSSVVLWSYCATPRGLSSLRDRRPGRVLVGGVRSVSSVQSRQYSPVGPGWCWCRQTVQQHQHHSTPVNSQQRRFIWSCRDPACLPGLVALLWKWELDDHGATFYPELDDSPDGYVVHNNKEILFIFLFQ